MSIGKIRINHYINYLVIGLMTVVLSAITFTGGIGENDDSIRERICSEMEFLGLKIDTELNKNASRNEAVFSAPDSKVLAMVLPTNEEIMIARDTLEVAGLR